jgi:hypothetical protein
VLADGREAPAPEPGSPAARLAAALRRYRHTGRPAALVTAGRLVEQVAGQPDPGIPHVHRGSLAVLLARLECADPWQADRPSGRTSQTAAARRSIASRHASGPRSR